ncbi:MAG: serine/threonine-protein kinase [Pseudomarimonas sp.]
MPRTPFEQPPTAGATEAQSGATSASPSRTLPAPPAARDNVRDGHFIPGTVLAGRYRLVALLGRGGMGEVYRADDLRLGQTVALKFLPAAFVADSEMRERFIAEVRIGRQVSHPNVCRLHDLVEIDGHFCLSMEYVDGEDLSALLARIGRLPADKAMEITRDLCAGLAAAHDKGVIHRDLKPANVMIDGKGRARIADFGIAALADSIDAELRAGTPAYMAPELAEGHPASVRSDLYALGLVLQEICTGQRGQPGRAADSSTPAVSNGWADVPLGLQQAIQRCLQRDPQARPASALAVMAGLPGGDPLQAAMAAGETPSPAMVAAAGTVGTVRVGVGWGLLLVALVGLWLLAWLAADTTLIGRVSPQTSPLILAERARTILADVGVNAPAVDWHYSYLVDESYFTLQPADAASPYDSGSLNEATPGPLQFLYRQSPEPLVAERTQIRSFGPAEAGRITLDDPALKVAGMADVLLDQQGRLLGLRVMASPPPLNPPAQSARPDWSTVFAAAHIDVQTLQPTTPKELPSVPADHRVAWVGRGEVGGGVPLHIEAASFAGSVVWFAQQPVSTPMKSTPLAVAATAIVPVSATLRSAMLTLMFCSILMWVAIAVMLRRNLRLGRSDSSGALRVSIFLFASAFLALLLRADHVPLLFEEASLISNLVAQTLLYTGIVWSCYIALEPVARRRWPQLLVGWSRLVAGRWRDPLVGRNALIGALAGIGMALVLHLNILLPEWLGWPAAVPRGRVLSSLAELRHLAHFALWGPFAAVILPFGTLLGWLIFHRLLRNSWLALTMLACTQYLGMAAFTGIEQRWSLASALFTAIYLLTTLRAGLLAGVVAMYVFLLLEVTPLTLDWSAWYADRTWLTAAILLGLLVGSFHAALGTQPKLGRLFDDGD